MADRCAGEIAAAYAAGLITAEEAICVAYYRGLYAELAQSPRGRPGAMMAVGMALEDATDFCRSGVFVGRLQVAGHNAPSSVTLSGDDDAVDEAVEVLKKQGTFARRLKVGVAYHSAHMVPCAAPYLDALRRLRRVGNGVRPAPIRNAPTWYSSVHGGRPMTASDVGPEYWVENLTGMVQFAPAVAAAAANGGPFDVALEVGPHPALKGPCSDVLEQVTGTRVPYSGTLARGEDDILSLANALGFVWTHLGPRSVQFDAFETAVSGAAPRKFLPNLPSYPFDHSRPSWAVSRVTGAYGAPNLAPPHPILGKRLAEQDTPREMRWRNVLKPAEVPWLTGHKLQDQTVVPAAAFVAMAVDAITVVAGAKAVALFTVEDLAILRGISFNDDASGIDMVFSLSITSEDSHAIRATFTCSSSPVHDVTKRPTLNAHGAITAVLGDPQPSALPSTPREDWNLGVIEVSRFYEQFASLGYGYAAPFRGNRSIRRRTGYALGTLVDESGSSWADGNMLLHPGLLDTAFQASCAAFSCPGDGRLWGVYVPAGVKRLTINPLFAGTTRTGESRVFPWEAALTSERDARVTADVSVFSHDDTGAFVHIMGLELVPLTPARPQDDTPLFSRWEYKVDRPDAELIASAEMPSEEREQAIAAERVAFYYVRRLLDMVSTTDALPKYRRLLKWAVRAIERVKHGKNTFVAPGCVKDDEQYISAIVAKYGPLRADIRVLEAVGVGLLGAVPGGSEIPEHLIADEGLLRSYAEALGLDEAHQRLAHMVAQIGHRYPHANVLEIGTVTCCFISYDGTG